MIKSIMNINNTSTPYIALNDIWIYYFHDPYDTDWSLNSYKNMQSISCISDFWSVHESVKQKVHLGMFFLMREHVFPCWDDPSNITGGCLSIKVLKQDMLEFWEYLSIQTLGESLLKKENVEFWDNVNGISTSPKKHFCIVKIWLKNDVPCSNVNFLTIPETYHGGILYKSNKDNIENNQTSR